MTVTAIPNAVAPVGADDKKSKAKGKEGKDGKKKGSKKKLIMIIVGVLVIGGGGYYKFLKPAPTGPPVPGAVVKIDAIQINLADGHYLRLALALQLVKGAKVADTSKAADAAISEFSGLPMTQVNDSKQRELLRTELVKMLKARYDGSVMGVYFTELVTQ